MITSGEFPGDGLPKAVAFPDPGEDGIFIEKSGIRFIALPKLVELKLASGQSAPHRLRDLADVQDLITRPTLPLAFADQLDGSVQDAYRDLWGKAQI